MQLDAAYRAYSKPLLAYAYKLGSSDPESLVHDAFCDAASYDKPILAHWPWLRLAMRRRHWKSLRRSDGIQDGERYIEPSQHFSAELSEIDSFLDIFGRENKEAFLNCAMGGNCQDEADKAGLTRQGMAHRLDKMQKKISERFLNDIDDVVLLKARQLCADSREYGDIVRRGILGGQWDNGEIVRSFYADAERQILSNREEVNDELLEANSNRAKMR